MKISITLFALLLFFSCEMAPSDVAVHKLDLSERSVSEKMIVSKAHFTSYLPIYSSVHSMSENEIRPITSTVSIHNMNLKDSLFVSKIDYYNTGGEFVRSYLDNSIFIKPMETINIVVHQTDNEGGSGANFLIDWVLNDTSANPPLIEAVMISTSGQQGISFTTRAVIMD